MSIISSRANAYHDLRLFLIDCSGQIAYVKQMNIQNTSKPSLILLCGPTASGKTAVSVQLAKLFGGEIVGADSMQIYRRMDIGTATPTPAEQQQISHHMINIIDPEDHFDIVHYQKMASGVISQILARQHIPFVVGGTGLYIKALLHGIFESPELPAAFRLRLRERLEEEGNVALHEELQKKDPISALKIHPNDRYRILRALETVQITGETLFDRQNKHQFHPEFYRTLKIGLLLDRELLYDRIDQRVDQMVATGFSEEVRSLLESGVSPTAKSMQSIGYRHAVMFLQGILSADEWIEKMKQDTRRYAKRQMTWFRADPQIHWVHPGDTESMANLIRTFLQTETDKQENA